MDVAKILSQLVRIGTVTVTDPAARTAQVKYADSGMTSGLLASRPYIPDNEGPQQTEYKGGGSGDPAYEAHVYSLIIKPWMPKVNATVLTLYLPILDADGFILGEIGPLGRLKQWADQ